MPPSCSHLDCDKTREMSVKLQQWVTAQSKWHETQHSVGYHRNGIQQITGMWNRYLWSWIWAWTLSGLYVTINNLTRSQAVAGTADRLPHNWLS